MADEQPEQPQPTPSKITDSTPSLLQKVREKHDRYLKNKMNVQYCTSILPVKEKILEEALKQLAYYQELCPRLTNDISLLRKRLEFSTKFLVEHEEEGETVKEAEKIARKIQKLELQMQDLVRKQKLAEPLHPTVGN